MIRFKNKNFMLFISKKTLKELLLLYKLFLYWKPFKASYKQTYLYNSIEGSEIGKKLWEQTALFFVCVLASQKRLLDVFKSAIFYKNFLVYFK